MVNTLKAMDPHRLSFLQKTSLYFGMSSAKTYYFWNNIPFIRLFLPLAAGILLQWHYLFSSGLLSAIFLLSVGAIFLHFLLPVAKKYQFNFLNGLFLHLLFAVSGALLVWKNDIRNDPAWIGKTYKKEDFIKITLSEPLVEKANSCKALGNVQSISRNGKSYESAGKIIVYFKKDPAVKKLSYGSQIIFNKPLQEIKNSGNPGSFDYRRYSLFQGITHQVYLAPDDFEQLPQIQKSRMDEAVFQCRLSIAGILQKFISGAKEQGLAEALLIGYKDDLDKSLVQSYSNTGVVHIIAISGLHLGLIYGLLLLLTRPVKRNKKLIWVRFTLIVAGLWLFSFLAGAQPSVLRSSVMFTCIALGEVVNRRASIYNTLAMSAFILLCYNPFWLWDVGFQLSYTAVLSIVIFFRPVYNWLYFPNKAIDALWKLNAVTIAAQILTLPVSLYHFHQFPVLFLFSNFIAVPLSSVIVIGEILLCAVSFVPPFAKVTGMVLEVLIRLMNLYVERLNDVSFAIWNGFSISLLQTVILLAAISFTAFWLIERKRSAIWLSLICFCVFISLRSYSFALAYRQKKLIVYNVPHHQAIDIISGRQYQFIGDSSLLADDFLRNFHLQPSRILNRVAPASPAFICSKTFEFSGKRILIMETDLQISLTSKKLPVDVLILSKNPKCSLSQIANALSIKQVVIDGSVPLWQTFLWERDCHLLHLPCHAVTEKGAFEMTVQ
jgi:competence protein ComEC